MSLKKELEKGALESLVPIIIHHEGCDVQAAVDQCVGLISASIFEFDKLSMEVLKRYPVEGMDRYIAACQQYCTGNLNWRWVRS